MTTHKTSVLALLTVLAGSTTLVASLDTQKAFVAQYPDAKATLGKCATCHTKPLPKKEDHELNAYGKDLKTVTVDKKTDFAKCEDKDSDGDGVKNGAEIKAGTKPGDPASK